MCLMINCKSLSVHVDSFIWFMDISFTLENFYSHPANSVMPFITFGIIYAICKINNFSVFPGGYQYYFFPLIVFIVLHAKMFGREIEISPRSSKC